MIGFGPMGSFEVETGTYGGSEAQKRVRRRGQFIQSITILGRRSREVDTAVFDDIAMHCNETATKLTLKFMELDHDRITVFRNGNELTIYYCDLSYSFIKLDEWCPNLTKLEIKNIDFSNDEWYDDWLTITETHKSPLLQSLSLEIGFDDVFAYFKLMEMQFPSLNNLYLRFGTETNFTAGRTLLSRLSGRNDKFLTDADRTYSSVYFNKLKRLNIFAYGQCEEIFNYLNISNRKLTELEFCGMNADDVLIRSMLNYPKLTKLTLACSYVEEEALNQLPDHLTKLMNVTLDTKYLYWNPSSIIKFMEDGTKLRRLMVKVERENENFQLDVTFRNRFQALVDGGRRFLQLNIDFFQSSHSIKFSRNALLDSVDEVDSDNSQGGD